MTVDSLENKISYYQKILSFIIHYNQVHISKSSFDLYKRPTMFIILKRLTVIRHLSTINDLIINQLYSPSFAVPEIFYGTVWQILSYHLPIHFVL